MFEFRKSKDTTWARTACLLAIVILFGGLFGSYLQTKYEDVIRVKRQKLERVVSSLELKLNGSLMAVELLAKDTDISGLEAEVVRPKLRNAVVTLGLQNAALFDVTGQLIVDAIGTQPPNVYDLASFEKALSGQSVISNRIIPEELKSAYVSLRVPVYTNNNHVLAILAASIPVSDLSSLVYKEELPDNQYIFIMDENGQFIHHPRLQQVFPEEPAYSSHVFPMQAHESVSLVRYSILDKVEKIFIYHKLEHTMWRVTYAVPLRTVYLETFLAAAPAMFVFFLLIAIIALMYHYIRVANRNREVMDMLKMERLSAATNMAAGIAHEVRNPLTSIKGFIQLMRKKEDKTNFNNYLEIILGEIERIDALINEFQSLARPLRQPNLIRADLSKVVSDVVMLMEAQAEQKHIKLEYSAQGELFDEAGLWVKVDVAQIKQVLINLIKNAFDAVSPGGRVRILLARNQEMPVITIEDNGTGIAQDVINKLGTPFFTTKEGGTGLGLSICYTIVHNHGGKIKVSSKLGEGTVFTVAFPPGAEEN